MFGLSRADSRFDVAIDHRIVSLREFVKARFERRIHFCDQRKFTVRELQLIAGKVECWRCRAPYDVFYTREIMRSNCGAQRTIMTDPGERVSARDDPYSALRNSRLAKRVFTPEVKQLRFSVNCLRSDTAGRFYWCFACPECNTMYGSHYFGFLIYEAEGEGYAPFCSKELTCSGRRAEPHWCFPLNGAFCT